MAGFEPTYHRFADGDLTSSATLPKSPPYGTRIRVIGLKGRRDCHYTNGGFILDILRPSRRRFHFCSMPRTAQSYLRNGSGQIQP